MEVFALYGPSGTGKSSLSLTLAHRYGIEAIIDDGILIYQGRKVAGTSAKYEKTKIQAVKRAIFFDPEHAAEVGSLLSNLPIERILILATSKRMILRIVDRLGLPAVTRYIPIESVKPESDIRAAQYIRETQGKHVIPVPRVEIEKDFFQRIIHSVQQILSAKKEVIGETTIVHPPFAKGRIQVYEQVLRKIVQAACYRFPQVGHVYKTNYSFHDLPRLNVSLKLKLPYGTPIMPLVKQIQQEIYEETSFCLNIPPASVDILVQSLHCER